MSVHPGIDVPAHEQSESTTSLRVVASPSSQASPGSTHEPLSSVALAS